MKNNIIILISIVVAFISLNAIAQNRFLEGKNIIDSETFEARFAEGRLVVWNSKNKYPVPLPNGEHPPLPIRKGDMHVDTAQQRKIIYEVLADKREKLHQQHEPVSIRYVFGQDGNVINIELGFVANTMITPKEIAVLDKRLRKEIKATLKGTEYLQFPAIHFSQKVIYF